MPDTGAPWYIPYVAGTDLVADWPTDSQELATAIEDGLNAAGGFDTAALITATDASWSVPTLLSPIVRVTVIGGGGGGGGAGSGGGTGGDGTASVFGVGQAFETTASGGYGGYPGNNLGGAGLDGNDAYSFAAGNHGQGGYQPGSNPLIAQNGTGGQIVVAYIDLTGISTLSVTVGAGGTGDPAAGDGGDGGAGLVIVEYKAG